MLIERTSEFLKLWEKFEESPYRDSAGVWTIGYGFTTYGNGLEVREFDDPMSKAEAENILVQKLTEIAEVWARTYPHWKSLNVFRKSAILSLSYNTGYVFRDGNHDTLDKALESNLLAVPEVLLKYCKADGKVLLGLLRRRRSEGSLWDGCSPEAAYGAYQEWEPTEADETATPDINSCPPEGCAIATDTSKAPEVKVAKQKKPLTQKLDM